MTFFAVGLVKKCNGKVGISMKLKDLELTKEESKQLVELKTMLIDMTCFGHNMKLDANDERKNKGYTTTEVIGATLIAWFDKLYTNPLGKLVLLAFRESIPKQAYLIKCEEAAQEFSTVEDDLKDTITELKFEVQGIIEQLDKAKKEFEQRSI